MPTNSSLEVSMILTNTESCTLNKAITVTGDDDILDPYSPRQYIESPFALQVMRYKSRIKDITVTTAPKLTENSPTNFTCMLSELLDVEGFIDIYITYIPMLNDFIVYEEGDVVASDGLVFKFVTSGRFFEATKVVIENEDAYKEAPFFCTYRATKLVLCCSYKKAKILIREKNQLIVTSKSKILQESECKCEGTEYSLFLANMNIFAQDEIAPNPDKEDYYYNIINQIKSTVCCIKACCD